MTNSCRDEPCGDSLLNQWVVLCPASDERGLLRGRGKAAEEQCSASGRSVGRGEGGVHCCCMSHISFSASSSARECASPREAV